MITSGGSPLARAYHVWSTSDTVRGLSPHRRHFWRVTSCPCLPCLVDIRYVSYLLTDRTHDKTRRSLGGAHVPPTKVFRQLTGSVNKTIVKPLVAAAVGRKTILKPRVAAAANTYTSDFPDVKFSVAALKRYRRKHPVPASGL